MQAFQGTGRAALSLDHARFLMAPKAKPGQLFVLPLGAVML